MDKKRRPLRLVKKRQTAEHCTSRGYCLLSALDPGHAELLNAIIRTRGPFRAGDRIYRHGEPFDTLYSVQTGSLKTEMATREGRAQVSGFYFAGELLGTDAIGARTYPSDAVVLEQTWLCAIPARQFLDLCAGNPALQEQLLGRMGDRIRADEYGWMLNRNERAEQRLMIFLHDLYQRRVVRTGRRTTVVELTMRKEDIANYLGLTPESLSRTLRKLQEAGIIDSRLRAIELLDLDALSAADET
ncbi:Crp/Fnr family transcriptional regulator [Thioalbus denitrificans]|uniref:CRP/FNR family transcriptional regulator n=1 Tax=Thioalbus denitrificans TaxID=547122 RepID=A0A369BXQ2_9GAMM|nr:helix-turn-helix domain-containing protein [Thioalbus denitrificans]RCX26482.1 CRP/FNR family transcriptional regulator [Thioalbus denitrificans]